MGKGFSLRLMNREKSPQYEKRSKIIFSRNLTVELYKTVNASSVQTSFTISYPIKSGINNNSTKEIDLHDLKETAPYLAPAETKEKS